MRIYFGYQFRYLLNFRNCLEHRILKLCQARANDFIPHDDFNKLLVLEVYCF